MSKLSPFDKFFGSYYEDYASSHCALQYGLLLFISHMIH